MNYYINYLPNLVTYISNNNLDLLSWCEYPSVPTPAWSDWVRVGTPSPTRTVEAAPPSFLYHRRVYRPFPINAPTLFWWTAPDHQRDSDTSTPSSCRWFNPVFPFYYRASRPVTTTQHVTDIYMYIYIYQYHLHYSIEEISLWPSEVPIFSSRSSQKFNIISFYLRIFKTISLCSLRLFDTIIKRSIKSIKFLYY